MINIANLMIDIGIFLAVLLALEPSFTGLAIHEWFALSLAGMVIIHLLVHWQWMVSMTSKFFKNLFHDSRLNYIVDALFFIAFTAAVMTGLMVSHVVMPFLNIKVAEDPIWPKLHGLAADATLYLTALHTALHWDWFVKLGNRYLILPARSLLKKRASKPVEIEENKSVGD
ncbi:MAG: DUF4405 domain-containing protein [Anaerolineaceae bacterium]|nr:DUF4405 domain-containing protein [Anaerolineaceae bacterium]